MIVPLDMRGELMVYAQDHAPKRIPVDPEQADLGKIVMSPGTRVIGQLLDRTGHGVAGAVVTLDTSNGGNLEHVGLGFQFAVLTDDTGRFTLPPSQGKCRVWVTDVASIPNFRTRRCFGTASQR